MAPDRKEFGVGESVFILNGPFRDFELCVQDIRNGEAYFLVPLLGKMQELRIPIDDCMASIVKAA